MNHKRSPNNLDLTGLAQPDPLDELLLQSPMAQPDPWFVAETVARCRREGKLPSRNYFGFFLQSWTRISITSFAVVATVLVAIGHFIMVQPPVTVSEVPKKPVVDAFLVVASVDSSMEEECDDTSPM